MYKKIIYLFLGKIFRLPVRNSTDIDNDTDSNTTISKEELKEMDDISKGKIILFICKNL